MINREAPPRKKKKKTELRRVKKKCEVKRHLLLPHQVDL